SILRSFSRSRASPLIAAPALPQERRRHSMEKASALGVAHEGADHAILAAFEMALPQCIVLRQAKTGRSGDAMGAAGIPAIEGECRTVAAHCGDDLAVALAIAQCGAARRLLRREIVRKAIGAACADCERTRGLHRRWRHEHKARRDQRAQQRPTERNHRKAPPPRNVPCYPTSVATW